MSEKTYNGWTNYETWNVALWIDNEEGSYRYWRDECETAKKYYTDTDGNVDMDGAASMIARNLKDQVEEANPLADQASTYSDLLDAALSEVNWDEIARNWLEE